MAGTGGINGSRMSREQSLARVPIPPLSRKSFLHCHARLALLQIHGELSSFALRRRICMLQNGSVALPANERFMCKPKLQSEIVGQVRIRRAAWDTLAANRALAVPPAF